MVLADLDLVAVDQARGVDPLAVHVGAVQRAAVVEEPLAAARAEDRVVARDGHVVEKDVGRLAAADRRAFAGDGNDSPARPPPA